jgi:hypothetical protein
VPDKLRSKDGQEGMEWHQGQNQGSRSSCGSEEFTVKYFFHTVYNLVYSLHPKTAPNLLLYTFRKRT